MPDNKIPVTDKICPIMSHNKEGIGQVHCLNTRCALVYHCFPTYAKGILGEVIELHLSGEDADKLMNGERE
jgi:hypothetical protein